MANPILEMIQQQNQPQLRNNPLQMLQEFNKFKQQMAGINPQQAVMNLLKSGKMTQEQFEQLKEQAKQLSRYLR